MTDNYNKDVCVITLMSHLQATETTPLCCFKKGSSMEAYHFTGEKDGEEEERSQRSDGLSGGKSPYPPRARDCFCFSLVMRSSWR